MISIRVSFSPSRYGKPDDSFEVVIHDIEGLTKNQFRKKMMDATELYIKEVPAYIFRDDEYSGPTPSSMMGVDLGFGSDMVGRPNNDYILSLARRRGITYEEAALEYYNPKK